MSEQVAIEALDAEIEDAILDIEYELDRDLTEEERESVVEDLLADFDDDDEEDDE